MDRLGWIDLSISGWFWSVPEAGYSSSKGTERGEGRYYTVPQGQLTFDAEGIEQPGARLHSRYPHVPSSASGVTIGRGFDLGMQSASTIRSYMHQAGFDSRYISAATGAAGLRGQDARDYLESVRLGEISPQQQWRLFNRTYQEMALDVQRISNKSEAIERYGAVTWDSLQAEIKEIVVDLRYRGDYTPETRKRIQGFLSRNDLVGFSHALADRDFWVLQRGVPEERFRLRREYLATALTQ